ncbi:MAG: hydroxymethylbilane synthase [Candidatus Eisenbacteria sp.]|nr:hydroxymethylbilane synthase [Candidatus Eisenbacteria bacterium]
MSRRRLRVGVLDVESGHLHGTWFQEQLATKYPTLEMAIRAVGTRPRRSRIAENGTTIPIREFYSEPIYLALVDKRVDIGVHRMKDLPSELPAGVQLVAVTKRLTPLDVLVTADGAILDELEEGSCLGVSSLRRQAQLARYRPDLEIDFVVGSLSERMEMVDSGRLRGIVIAAAGIEWRGWQERVTEVFTCQVCIPAVGQGALGLVVREEDVELASTLRFLNHTMSQREVTAERAFHHGLGAWEGAPVGGLARVKGDILKIEGCISSLDGKQIIRGRAEGFPDDPVRTGERLAKVLLDKGAARILEDPANGPVF